ncbi:hypothetical protein KAR91_38725 [Candidatus Pacearchaeota archaeon]|nr:hypothetical protein [Candidatus Pacearchaeota archaeon]
MSNFNMHLTGINPSSLNLFPSTNILILKDMKEGKRKAPNYAKKTSTRKHFVPSLGLFASNFLSKGNSKLDKSMLIFDLLAIETCRNCSTCKASCYAMKSQQQYPGTFNRRSIHTWLVRHDLEYVESRLFAELSTTKRKIVRIHSSGDFDSQAYIDMWTRIIVKFPQIDFYTYTKVNTLFDFSLITRLNNFNMVLSVMPDGSRNYGSMSYILNQQKRFGGFICPSGVPGKGEESCGVTCKACVKQEIVWFKIH